MDLETLFSKELEDVECAGMGLDPDRIEYIDAAMPCNGVADGRVSIRFGVLKASPVFHMSLE